MKQMVSTSRSPGLRRKSALTRKSRREHKIRLLEAVEEEEVGDEEERLLLFHRKIQQTSQRKDRIKEPIPGLMLE